MSSLITESFYSRKDVWLALALTCVVFWFAHGDVLFAPYVSNDDVRQQVYWMQSWEDPALYQNDLLTEYAQRYVPWGVKGLYRLASPLVDPITFSKLLAGFEYIILGILLFLLGNGFGGRSTAWGVLCVYWLSPFFLHTISGGLARSFGAPLMALFWLCWQRGEGRGARWGLLASMVLMGLVIPYIYALCGLALAIGWVLGRLHLMRQPPAPRRLLDYLVLLGAAAPVLFFNHELAGSGFGPMASAQDMAGSPLFGPLGRFPIVPVPSLLYELVARPWERLLPFRELGLFPGILTAVLILLLAVLGARRVAWKKMWPGLQPFLCLFLASFFLYIAARMVLLALFIPSRYWEYTTNLGYCVLLGCMLGRYAGSRIQWKFVGVALVVLCLGMASQRLRYEALGFYGAYAPLYSTVRETDTNAVFAGHPYTLDNVLTFGRRKVLASYELAHPWSVGYWKRLSPRLEHMLRAYYAKDVDVVRDFCETWDVDYFVVDARDFSQAFVTPQRSVVPLAEAPLPDWLRTITKALDVRFPVIVWAGKRLPLPGDHPMFAPYGEMVHQWAQLPGKFVLLDDTLFPGREVMPGVKLVDVRGMRAAKAESGE